MDTTITLPAGGKLHASRSHLCLAFEKTRFSLSTAIYGGGFKEINYAVNQKLETFYPSEDRFPGGSVPEFLRLSILENGYDPAKACALLTAAKMEWRSVKTFSHAPSASTSIYSSPIYRSSVFSRKIISLLFQEK